MVGGFIVDHLIGIAGNVIAVLVFVTIPAPIIVGIFVVLPFVTALLAVSMGWR